MTVFFFVVGLEIKRELVDGELRRPRARRPLPIVAALGGMVVPAAIYLLLHGGGEGRRGWGIPMATDIAFAVGVLALLGPPRAVGLKILLLALAIVDDIGAIWSSRSFTPARFSWRRWAWRRSGLGLVIRHEPAGRAEHCGLRPRRRRHLAGDVSQSAFIRQLRA